MGSGDENAIFTDMFNLYPVISALFDGNSFQGDTVGRGHPAQELINTGPNYKGNVWKYLPPKFPSKPKNRNKKLLKTEKPPRIMIQSDEA